MFQTEMRSLLNLVEAKSKRPRTGTIPYWFDEIGHLYVCLFTSNNPEYGGSEPSVPKGGIDENESIAHGAIRETHEETGIPMSDLTDIMSVKTSVIAGMTSSYDLHVFASLVPQMTKLSPTREGQGKWMTIEDALREIRAIHKEFLVALVAKLNYKI